MADLVLFGFADHELWGKTDGFLIKKKGGTWCTAFLFLH
jgi:hypothetical protein